MQWIIDLNWALFLSALISSTLFPGGSEALLLYQLNQGNNPYTLVFVATAGNVLGSLITYWMGRYGFSLGNKWFDISQAKQAKAEAQFKRWGGVSLLFAWVPIIGDPLCLIAGALRYSILSFLLLVTIGKLARYTFIAWIFL